MYDIFSRDLSIFQRQGESKAQFLNKLDDQQRGDCKSFQKTVLVSDSYRGPDLSSLNKSDQLTDNVSERVVSCGETLLSRGTRFSLEGASSIHVYKRVAYNEHHIGHTHVGRYACRRSGIHMRPSHAIIDAGDLILSDNKVIRRITRIARASSFAVS